ncbi:MAG TPA: hypothetical protein VF590_27860 [Isosphaeraceae bacterium]
MSRGTGPLDPATACLERTRSAVLNVLVIDGCGIAASGLALGRRGLGIALWEPEPTRRRAYLALLGLTFVSYLLRRTLGARAALHDPRRRAGRFYWAHVLGAAVGTLALPLGFAYGWLIRPVPREVLPFWVVALALGVLSFPRRDEIEGFDRPIIVSNNEVHGTED